MTQNYTPNFENGHVQKRANKVLTWAAQFLIGKYGTDLPLHLSAKGFTDPFGKHVPGLNDVFGPKGNDLGDYLRAALLIPVSRSYTPGEKSMTYRLSMDGYACIERALGKTQTVEEAQEAPQVANGDTNHVEITLIDRLVQVHAEELHGLVFQYKDKAERLWHPLQNLKRAEKPVFWNKFGLPFDYDIEACAPTILFQLARQAGLPAVLLETLKEYLDDRSGFRSHVSTLTGLQTQQAKQLINSLFNGAKLGKNNQFSSFRLLDYNDEKMDALKADERVTRLVRDIARVWKRIENHRALSMRPTASDVLTGVTSATPWKLKTSKQKWSVYFEQERRVLDAITAYLAEQNIRVFTEHDGFRTDTRVHLPDLETYVLKATGLEMKIDGPK